MHMYKRKKKRTSKNIAWFRNPRLCITARSCAISYIKYKDPMSRHAEKGDYTITKLIHRKMKLSTWVAMDYVSPGLDMDSSQITNTYKP